jgi:uncharacterized membrane protein YfcA
VSYDPAVLAIAALGVFVIAFMKGSFGGGFAILGIPLLSLVMDPLMAGALLAPLFVVMDACALYYWRPSTWSKPDVILLAPSMAIGIGLGFLTLSILDPHVTAIVMAVITLAFVGAWLFGSGNTTQQPRSTTRAIAAGTASGMTTMIAHSGGPPLAMYLLPLGMPKALYAGTTSIVFTISNLLKAGPWLIVARPTTELWTLMLFCVPIIPLGVWAGWKLHERLDEAQLYRACYILLVVVAAKLLWDGVTGYLA